MPYLQVAGSPSRRTKNNTPLVERSKVWRGCRIAVVGVGVVGVVVGVVVFGVGVVVGGFVGYSWLRVACDFCVFGVWRSWQRFCRIC